MPEPDFTTTVVLVRDAQKGDRDALDSLFDRYLPRVRQIVALRMGQRLRQFTELDDLAQEALLSAFQGLERFEHQSEGSFRNWLARCVECAIVDCRRGADAAKRGGGNVRLFGDIDTEGFLSGILPGEGPTPSEVVKAKELEETLETALLKLPEHHRELIVLRHLCQMSYAEVAKAMNFAKEDSARRGCARALQKLREAAGL